MSTAQAPSDPLAKFALLPGALPTQPIARAKHGLDFTLDFLEDAHKYFDSFHMQLGGDHATYYCTHFSEFLPSTNAIPYGPASKLERAINPALGKTTFKAVDADPVLPLDEYVLNGKARVQGLMIAHRGKVVYEQYPGIQPNQPHLLFSVTKTTVGLMMAMLQADDAIDVRRVVSDYVPEVKGTVWDTIKVINVLNMAAGLKDIEELFPRPGGNQEGTLLDPHSLMCRFFYATFGRPNADGKIEKWIDVVRSVQPDPTVPQGTKMQYSSMLTHMLAVIVEHVAGRRFSKVFEDRVWSKIGARNPAEFAATPDGTTMAYGFLSLALEDLVRYGMIYTPSVSVISKEEVVPQAAFDLIQNGGDPKAYYGTGDYQRGFQYFGEETYKNSYQWDSLFKDGGMWKHGNLAQGLYVDPSRDVVGAYFSTNPLTGVWDRSGGYIRAAAKLLARG